MGLQELPAGIHLPVVVDCYVLNTGQDTFCKESSLYDGTRRRYVPNMFKACLSHAKNMSGHICVSWRYRI